MPRVARDAFLGEGAIMRYSDGALIFARGDQAQLTTVIEGAVRRELVDPSGHTTELATLGPGQVFGEAAALGGIAHVYDAVAVGETRVHHLSLASFERLCGQHPKLPMMMLGTLAQRMMLLVVGLDDIRRFSVNERLGRVILRAGKPVSSEQGAALVIEVTQAALASSIGIDRATIVRALRALKNLGLVRTHYGAIEIPDPQAMQNWLDQQRRARGQG